MVVGLRSPFVWLVGLLRGPGWVFPRHLPRRSSRWYHCLRARVVPGGFPHIVGPLGLPLPGLVGAGAVVLHHFHAIGLLSSWRCPPPFVFGVHVCPPGLLRHRRRVVAPRSGWPLLDSSSTGGLALSLGPVALGDSFPVVFLLALGSIRRVRLPPVGLHVVVVLAVVVVEVAAPRSTP